MTDRDDSPAQAASNLTPHETSLAIWDVPSPLVLGGSLRMKVGVRCSSGCSLTGQRIRIEDASEQQKGEGTLGLSPWPGTTGLYWAEVDVAAPPIEGTHTWTARFTAANLDAPHLTVSSTFTFMTVKPPEHRVTVEVVQQGTKNPIDISEVRLGVYRTVTDAAGIAHLELPK